MKKQLLLLTEVTAFPVRMTLSPVTTKEVNKIDFFCNNTIKTRAMRYPGFLNVRRQVHYQKSLL